MSKARSWPFLAALILLLSAIASASAQEEPPPALGLHLRRDWGYGGIGEIEGNFTISVSGPADLVRVIFRLDDQVMADLTQPPWKLKFHTSQYSAESHSLYALGYTSDGRELRSSETRVRFLSSQQAGKAGLGAAAIGEVACGAP